MLSEYEVEHAEFARRAAWGKSPQSVPLFMGYDANIARSDRYVVSYPVHPENS